MKAAIIIFPGTNREQDMKHALILAGFDVSFVFYHDNALPSDIELVVLPGGFSYGDYLRTGAMAAVTPIMGAVKEFAHDGGKVLGVCNGFQILCEVGLLPGILMHNENGRFICNVQPLCVVNNQNDFLSDYSLGQDIHIPIAHGEGNYFADEVTLARLEKENRIVLRYLDNPNGSQNDIAAIINKQGNVLGMMPHPENHVDIFQDNKDGLPLFTSLAKARSKAA